MRRLSPAVAVLAALGAAVPAVGQAQSAKDVINRMIAEYEKRAAGVRNYTIVQEAMGMPMTMYFEKETVNGRPVFRLRQTTVGGRTTPGGRGEDDFDLYADLPRIVERAAYKGRETVDGQATDVVTIDDLKDLRFGRGMVPQQGPQQGDFQPKRATVFVDTRLSVPRRVILEGTMRTQDRSADVTATVDMLDYREVQGMLHPFRTQVKMDGLGQAADPEMKKQYDEMKKQLAELPEAQRQAMEQMMKGRLEQIEKMMGADGGMNVEVVVRDVRVNQGAPGR
jgi:hypothetical protein